MAQEVKCPGAGVLKVDIDRPAGGATVSGTVTVAGRVQSSLFRASKVELRVRGEVVDSSSLESSDPEPTYTLSWNSASVPGGSPETLTVVACGEGVLSASGQDSVTVNVAAVATSTTRPLIAPPPPSVVAEPGPPTTVGRSAVTSTTKVARAAGNTTTTTAAAADANETDFVALLGQVSRRSVNETDSGDEPFGQAPPLTEPLVLQDAEDAASPRRPPWIGLVVGIFGVLGLVASAALRRRGDPFNGPRRRGSRRNPMKGVRRDRSPRADDRDLYSLRG